MSISRNYLLDPWFVLGGGGNELYNDPWFNLGADFWFDPDQYAVPDFTQDTDSFAPQPGGDLQGDVSNPVTDALEGITGLIDSIFGGDAGNVMIPIPGLPVSIPGNISWQDLLDIAVEVATNTGQAVNDVLDQILSGVEAAGETVPDPGTGDPIDPGATPDPGTDPGEGTPATEDPLEPEDPITEDPNEDDPDLVAYCSAGMPFGVAGNDWLMRCGDRYNTDGTPKTPGEEIEDPVDEDPATPGLDPEPPEVGPEPDPVMPGVDGDLNDPPDDSENPALDPGGNDELEEDEPDWLGLIGSAAGLGALIPGFLNRDRPERDPLTPGRTLMQARPTEFAERPDYGDPTPMDLFDFGERVSQPTQVGYDPEPRRDTMSALERERLRRLRRQGII